MVKARTPRAGPPVAAGSPAESRAAALTIPPALAPGDTVALFFPSSHTGRNGGAQVESALAILAEWKLRPLALPEPPRRHLYLAGTDAERAKEFQRLYTDPAVKALFAARGGYGAARLLPHLDAGRIAAAPPKAVVGMSDVVALFSYLHTVAGVSVLHASCLAAASLATSPLRTETLADLHAWLFGPPPARPYGCTLLHAPAGGGSGTAPVAARLLGGNLAVLASLLGTPWAPETAGCLLFLEDVNEQPYRVDRYLTQLRQAGRLDGVAGVVFGHMQNCDSEPPGLLDDVLRDLFAGAPYPVATGLEAGHGPRNRALPLGRRAELAWEAARAGAPATLTVA
jgi:muramoyltetrapeptide carboxypeptidase